ncbi:hypothetical protein V6N13_021307 [Hibiscus sabdariffa]
MFDLPSAITVDLGNDNCVEVGVELDWAPPKCSHCAIFGHTLDNCKKMVLSNECYQGDSSCSLKGVESDAIVPKVGTAGAVGDVMSDSVEGLANGNVADGMVAGVVNESVNAEVVGGVVVGSDGGVAVVIRAGVYDASIEVVVAVDSVVSASLGDVGSVAFLKEMELGVMVWNVKGFNDPLKQKKVLRVVQRLKAEVVCLLETRVQTLDVIGKSAQALTCYLSKGDFSFFFSFIYACNGREERVALWRELVGLKVRIGNSSWALAGDFNIVAKPQESSDFNGSQGMSGVMLDFVNGQGEIDVTDHPFSGNLFTWCNHREKGPLSRKLDRVLVNQSWLCSFPGFSVEFLNPDCSDHSPSFLVLQAPIASPPKPFNFFGFWSEHSEFLSVIDDSWKVPVLGNPLRVLFAKLKRVKEPLKKFSKEKFGGISNRVLQKRVEYENIQNSLLVSPSTDLILQERVVRNELRNLERAEEMFYLQKSRVQYVREDDQNTAFFFRRVVVRQKKSTIQTLQNRHGQKLDTFEAISVELVDYFSSSLGVVDGNVEKFPDGLIQEILGCGISESMKSGLVTCVTDTEIKDVLFGMDV